MMASPRIARIARYLICGDTIFPGGPGKTTSPADFRQILESITQKVLILPCHTELYPGHGESTTPGQARSDIAVIGGAEFPAGPM